MSNLEDVFLKINQEFAPDLFGGLKNRGFDAKSHSAMGSDSGSDSESYVKNRSFAKSIGHSTQNLGSSTSKSKAEESHELDDSTGSNSSGEKDSMDSKEFEKDETNGQNLIRGSSCARSCTASAAKRIIIYRRDWCGVICQIIIPIILVIFGLWLASGASSLAQSPPRHLSTGWYEGPQRMYMNTNPVDFVGDGGDVTS